jgi:hypothetical protein
VFVELNFPFKPFKKSLASCTLLTTDIGIPTPAIAVGTGKNFNTLYAASNPITISSFKLKNFEFYHLQGIIKRFVLISSKFRLE